MLSSWDNQRIRERNVLTAYNRLIKNGSKKIYISIDYLDSKFKIVNNRSKGVNDTLGNDTSNQLIEVLKSQLLEKDKQINELIERSRESNILLSQMQQKVLMLDEPKKKKWWQRK